MRVHLSLHNTKAAVQVRRCQLPSVSITSSNGQNDSTHRISNDSPKMALEPSRGMKNIRGPQKVLKDLPELSSESSDEEIMVDSPADRRRSVSRRVSDEPRPAKRPKESPKESNEQVRMNY